MRAFVLLGLLAAARQERIDDRNLLANASFEEYDGDYPRDWSAVAPIQFRTSTEFMIDLKEYRDGKRSARVRLSAVISNASAFALAFALDAARLAAGVDVAMGADAGAAVVRSNSALSAFASAWHASRQSLS